MPYLSVALFLLALAPAALVALTTGDFTQVIFKPSRRRIYQVLRNRGKLGSASLAFWLIGLLLSQTVAPVPLWAAIACALTAALLHLAGLVLPGYVLFRGVKEPVWLPAIEDKPRLRKDEPVIGVTAGGECRAIPLRWIHRPHLVRSQFGRESVTVTYCLLSNSAMAFRTGADVAAGALFTPLQWENNRMLYDATRGQLYQQLEGRVLFGPQQGRALERVPTRIMPWGAWHRLHPETMVLHHPPGSWIDRLMHRMTGKLMVTNRLQEAPIFPTVGKFDRRLPIRLKCLVLNSTAPAGSTRWSC